MKSVFEIFFLCLADTAPLVFSNHKSTHDVQKDSEVKEDLQDDRNIRKQDDSG